MSHHTCCANVGGADMEANELLVAKVSKPNVNTRKCDWGKTRAREDRIYWRTSRNPLTSCITNGVWPCLCTEGGFFKHCSYTTTQISVTAAPLVWGMQSLCVIPDCFLYGFSYTFLKTSLVDASEWPPPPPVAPGDLARPCCLDGNEWATMMQTERYTVNDISPLWSGKLSQKSVEDNMLAWYCMNGMNHIFVWVYVMYKVYKRLMLW